MNDKEDYSREGQKVMVTVIIGMTLIFGIPVSLSPNFVLWFKIAFVSFFLLMCVVCLLALMFHKPKARLSRKERRERK